MRSNFLKKILSFVLSIVFYLILLPLLMFVRDFLGINNQIVFNIIHLFVLILVYVFVSAIVHILLLKLNERLLIMRKAHGGRDITAEERHENEDGIISLSLNDEK